MRSTYILAKVIKISQTQALFAARRLTQAVRKIPIRSATAILLTPPQEKAARRGG